MFRRFIRLAPAATAVAAAAAAAARRARLEASEAAPAESAAAPPAKPAPLPLAADVSWPDCLQLVVLTSSKAEVLRRFPAAAGSVALAERVVLDTGAHGVELQRSSSCMCLPFVADTDRLASRKKELSIYHHVKPAIKLRAPDLDSPRRR